MQSTFESITGVKETLRRAAEQSGMTQGQIDRRMGFSKESARQFDSRLLNHKSDRDLLLLAFGRRNRDPG